MNTINLRLFKDQKLSNYSIWHPYANICKCNDVQIELVRGKGIYVYDSNNKEYIDAASGLWNVSLGYDNEHIINSIKTQLDRLPYCSLFDYTNKTAITAANMILSEVGENMQKIFYTCSGSESIELALKLARKYWRLLGYYEKQGVLSIKESYHGTYYGSMGVSGCEEDYYYEFGNENETIFLRYIDENESFSEDTVQDIKEIIDKNHDKIACIVIEPILASEGVKVINPLYLQWLESFCRKKDILIIIDEIALGFYRTGTNFYYKQIKLSPDFLCISKGINSGYLPIGAVAISKKIYKVYYELNDFIAHGSTQGGNLISCAACIASIEEYKTRNIEENVNDISIYLKKRITECLFDHPNFNGVRGKGLMLSIDLVNNRYQKKFLSLREIGLIKSLFLENGLIVYSSRLGITLLPMLIINRFEAEKIVFIIENVMKKSVFFK